MRVLLAGASGQVGRRVLANLSGAGYEVRAIRGVDLTVSGAANGLAEGCAVVVSCAGASVAMAAKDRRGYEQVDPVLNRNLLPEAQRGIVPWIGNGQARTNPIDPQDVADLMVSHLHDGPAEVPCGGPEVLTRAEINQTLAQACGKPDPWMPQMPAAVVRLEAKAVRLFHPRMADLMEFFAAVATTDCVAPPLGQRRLKDYRF